MKKFNLFTICCIAVIAILFSACTDKPAPTQANLINGKWEVVSIQIKTITNGVIENESYIGKPSDFVNFKDDNTVQSSVDEIGETVLYKILPDNKVSIDNEIFDIKTLTTNTCILYSKTVIDNNNSEEQTISLKK